MEESETQESEEPLHHSSNKESEIQYGGWGLRYLYQFATVNPLLGILIALLIVILFAMVIPILFTKLFVTG